MSKKDKKKILIVGTGGTIAAVKTESGLRPAYKTEELISFFPEAKQLADIDGKQLFNLDSTNMQPHHWSEIVKEIEKQYDKYDGFVITHGTDTMQYTAAALAFMIQNLTKPVVLTGSAKPLGKNSDAKQNFNDSLLVACSDLKEVCIVFNGNIIKGCRVRKVTNEATKIINEKLKVYSSINYHLIGETIGKFKNNHIRRIIFGKGCVQKEVKSKIKFLADVDAQSLFVLRIYPGLRPEIFDKLTNFRCILIEAYGPGNIPFMENGLVEKIEMLTKKNIPVFITTQNPFGEVDLGLYEVGQKAQKAGAISCKDMTVETAIVKLMWIMGNFGNDYKTIKRLMLKNFAGEIREK